MAPAISFVHIYKSLFSRLWFIQIWAERETPGKEGWGLGTSSPRKAAESRGGTPGPQDTCLGVDYLGLDHLQVHMTC